MRRRKQFTFCLFPSWFDVLLSMLSSGYKQTALFNNCFLNADEAVGALPIHLYAKEILCTLS